ncbi:uncharacterized protein LOC113147620 [Cyclospora cayetanensis]|uniref:Uncharacterized protein LOC113147620 n=1 Tax=Cyclospora cayetanensis TaxID=88456 RepID=A0A6P6S3W1_9EIME|nr:uncharacterized protein LOC113147620 [Cyclospora cayetanensis]
MLASKRTWSSPRQNQRRRVVVGGSTRDSLREEQRGEEREEREECEKADAGELETEGQEAAGKSKKGVLHASLSARCGLKSRCHSSDRNSSNRGEASQVDSVDKELDKKADGKLSGGDIEADKTNKQEETHTPEAAWLRRRGTYATPLSATSLQEQQQVTLCCLPGTSAANALLVVVAAKKKNSKKASAEAADAGHEEGESHYDHEKKNATAAAAQAAAGSASACLAACTKMHVSIFAYTHHSGQSPNSLTLWKHAATCASPLKKIKTAAAVPRSKVQQSCSRRNNEGYTHTTETVREVGAHQKPLKRQLNTALPVNCSCWLFMPSFRTSAPSRPTRRLTVSHRPINSMSTTPAAEIAAHQQSISVQSSSIRSRSSSRGCRKGSFRRLLHKFAWRRGVLLAAARAAVSCRAGSESPRAPGTESRGRNSASGARCMMNSLSEKRPQEAEAGAASRVVGCDETTTTTPPPLPFVPLNSASTAVAAAIPALARRLPPHLWGLLCFGILTALAPVVLLKSLSGCLCLALVACICCFVVSLGQQQLELLQQEGLRRWVPPSWRVFLEERRLLDGVREALMSGAASFYLSRILCLSLGEPTEEEALALLEGMNPSVYAVLAQRGPLKALPPAVREVYYGGSQRQLLQRESRIAAQSRHQQSQTAAEQDGLLLPLEPHAPLEEMSTASVSFSATDPPWARLAVPTPPSPAAAAAAAATVAFYEQERDRTEVERKTAAIVTSVSRRVVNAATGSRKLLYPAAMPLVLHMLLARFLFGSKMDDCMRSLKKFTAAAVAACKCISVCVVDPHASGFLDRGMASPYGPDVRLLLLPCFSQNRRRRAGRFYAIPAVLLLVLVYIHLLQPETTTRLQRLISLLSNNRRAVVAAPSGGIRQTDPHLRACVELLRLFLRRHFVPRIASTE